MKERRNWYTALCIGIFLSVGLSLSCCLTAGASASGTGEAVPEGVSSGDLGSQEGIQRDYIKGRPLREEEKEAVRSAVEAYAGQGGYLPLEKGLADGSEDSGEAIFGQDLPSAVAEEFLPERYDARQELTLPGIKEQKYGDCWAIAALDLLSMNGVKKKMGVELLSPRHLVYYAFHSVTATPGQQQGEGTTYLDNGKEELCFWNGGRFEYAIRTLESHVGAVREASVPYARTGEGLPPDGDLVYGHAPIRLKNAYIIPSADRQGMKKAVLEYGAVGITYCSTLSYYNYDTAAQYCPYDVVEDHAVAIIGWNDHYSRYNFSQFPENDGAWLVKNNWGTVFGDQGYFWLSYEDASIASQAYILEAERGDRYDHIYQCDSTLLDGKESAEDQLTISNRYLLSAALGRKEKLEAVRISVPVGNLEYELQLYLNSQVENPESGLPLLELPLEGFLPYAGTYTIDLPDGIEEAQGSALNIVFCLKGKEPGVVTDVTKQSGRTLCHAVGGDGVSFWKQNGLWEDYGKEKDRNFRLKLLTNSGSEQEISPEDVFRIYQAYQEAEEKESGSGIYLLYRMLLNREGETSGVQYWREKQIHGADPVEILYGFLYSEEWTIKNPMFCDGREVYMLCCMGNGDAGKAMRLAEAIEALYRRVLNRRYDLPGFLYWGRRYMDGLSLEEMEGMFYRSEEYQKLVF